MENLEIIEKQLASLVRQISKHRKKGGNTKQLYTAIETTCHAVVARCGEVGQKEKEAEPST